MTNPENYRAGAIVSPSDNLYHKGQILDLFKDDKLYDIDDIDDSDDIDKLSNDIEDDEDYIGLIKVVSIEDATKDTDKNSFSILSLYKKSYKVYCERI